MILNKILCILIAGKAGVGKTTSAKYINKYLREKYSLDGDIFPFAKGVKDCAITCFGWDGNKDEKGRILLQNIGRTGRIYDKDVWVNKTISSFYSSSPIYRDYMLVDDWRYPNEKIKLENDLAIHLVTIRIESPEREVLKGTPAADDSSETSLASATEATDSYYSYVIDNVSSFEDLYSSLEVIIDKEIGDLNFASDGE